MLLGLKKAYPLSVFFNKSIIKNIIEEIFKTIDSFVLLSETEQLNKEKYIVDDMVYNER